MTQQFPFPFTPYKTQKELMNQIYDCIDSKSTGFFESPTGTGKSLSIICSAGQWLRQEEKRILDSVDINKSKSAIIHIHHTLPNYFVFINI